MTENKENEILLNIMYNGDYLMSDNKNIGHEVINLFQSDNDNNYIYVLPYGCMAKKHNDKIKTILLVKRHNANLLEVLAKAEGLDQILKLKNSIYREKNTNDKQNNHVQETHSKQVNNTKEKYKEKQLKYTKDLHDEQLNYIKENKITYGGVELNKIMDKNKGSDIAFYVTFKAERIVKPKERIFLTLESEKNKNNSENCYILTGLKNFARQSPKMYISESKKSQKDAYDELIEIINDEKLWETDLYTKKVSIEENDSNTKQYDNNDFIDIIKKGYDELSYSNLFQYIFNANNELFYKFTKEVLKVNTDGNYTVERETDNIDLLIKSENKIIVIENKIKSGINGIRIENGEIVGTQLQKYKEYVDENFPNASLKSYFVFTPDYNIIDLSKFDKSKEYKLITYSKIYDFFYKNRANCRDIPYYKEFLYALKKHIKEIDNNNDIDAERRFVKAIKEKQK